MMCSSESVLSARSAAVLAANSASLEPSVARRIVVGKMLIGRPLSSMRSRLEAYDASQRAPALLRKRYSPYCPEKRSEKSQRHGRALTLGQWPDREHPGGSVGSPGGLGSRR